MDCHKCQDSGVGEQGPDGAPCEVCQGWGVTYTGFEEMFDGFDKKAQIMTNWKKMDTAPKDGSSFILLAPHVIASKCYIAVYSPPEFDEDHNSFEGGVMSGGWFVLNDGENELFEEDIANDPSLRWTEFHFPIVEVK